MTLLDRDRAVLWHPYTQVKTAPAPLSIVRGEGVWLITEDGRRILDGISSWWVNIHGHSHPRLNEALARQAGRLEHVLFAGCTHEPAVELAERLLAILPRGLTRIFYTDNGSTAVEAALKMALQFWKNRGERGRTKIVALQDAYHGDTTGAMSVSERSVFTSAFDELLFEIVRVERSEAAIAAALDERVAAIIVEPILQGAGGMIVWPATLLAAIRRLCDERGVLLIADEVLTGFGRTGRMFACEHAAITPDIICLSKALTGGYLPLAVTAVTSRVYDAFLSDDRARAFFHGHSYTANPLACAVALASLELFGELDLLARIARLERQMRDRLEPLRALDHVRDVRVIGGIGAVELHGHGYLDQAGPRIAAEFLRRNLLIRPLGNVVYFMPPYAISDEEAAWALDHIVQVLRALGDPSSAA